MVVVENKKIVIKVALIGDLCLDIFLQIPAYPEKGGDGLAEKMVKQTGGSASNTAVALAHLGCEPRLITHTGNDLWAQQILATLVGEGVIIDQVVREENESTGITFLAVTPDGERTMFTYRGANALLNPSEITPETFADISMLHLSGYACLTRPQSDAVMKAVEIAGEKGIGITLDIGVEPAYKMGDALIRMLPKLTLLILGESEACTIAATRSVSDAVNFLVDHGVKIVGLKQGKNGCQLTTREKQVHIPGFKVKTVDTTGAGDAFTAAMIFGLSQKWSLETTGLLANAMGGLAATRWGAGAALPGKQEIIQFLSTEKNQTRENKTRIQELIKRLQD
ncbi:MAG: ribokinase [Chloroflexi bacterium]|nr:MAG: ribokinase [Chloroflexota bacterium]